MNADQLAELHEQGKNVYVKKRKWPKKLGLEKQKYEQGDKDEFTASNTNASTGR